MTNTDKVTIRTLETVKRPSSLLSVKSHDVIHASGRSQAVAYIRVSTTKQATSGLGEIVQRQEIERWAIATDTAVRVYCDAGVSGARVNRPTLDAAMLDAKRSKAPIVVMCLSRLARSTVQTLQLVDRIVKQGSDIVSIRETLDTRSACGKAMLGMLAVMSQLERDLASERTTDAMRSLRASGRKTGGAMPFGFVAASGGEIERDPRMAWVVREIAMLHLAGLSLRRIAAEVNRRNIPTAQGKRWHPQTVSSVLRLMITRPVQEVAA
jgi:site-specific DNA recombinase